MNKIKVENLKKSFKKHQILNDINLEINADSIICLIGQNGVGKTTLLKTIAGNIQPDEGTIQLNGKFDIDKLQDILLIQDKTIIPSNITIANAITIFSNRNKNYNRSYVDRYLDFLNLNENVIFGHLSKGNQEIVQIALLASNMPKFILFDEPLASVDIKKREFLFDQLIELSSDGVGIVISTHIVNEIQNIFTDVVTLTSNGRINSKSLDELYELGYNQIIDYVKDEI